MATTLLAIDWDHDTLRIVQASVGRATLKITKALSVLLADDVDIDRPDSLGPFIARVLEEQRISTRTAVIDLPRDQVVLQKVALPPTPEIDLAASVLYQVGRELPFPLDDAVVDFVVTRRSDAGLATEAVAAAVRTEILNRLTLTCEKAGLVTRRVGLRPYANMVAARYGRPAGVDDRMLFVDVGPELTEIDVFRGHSLVFSRSASVSVPIIPDDEVQDMLAGGAVPERLQPVLDEVMVEVARSLQAYRMSDPDTTLSEIVIAGGTGLEPVVAHAMRQRGDANVSLFDASKGLGLPAEQGQALRAFAAALGLAIGSGRPGVFHLDFLHPKKADEVRRRRRRQRAWLGGVAAAGVFGLIGWPVYATWSLNAESETFQRTVVEEAEKRAAEVTAFKKNLDQLTAWRDREYAWLDELQRLNQALPSAGELYLTNLSVQESGQLALAGRLRDKAVLLRLANKLNDSGVLMVRPVEAKEAPDTQAPGYPYRFDMLIQVRKRLAPAQIQTGKQGYSLATAATPAPTARAAAPQPPAAGGPAPTPTVVPTPPAAPPTPTAAAAAAPPPVAPTEAPPGSAGEHDPAAVAEALKRNTWTFFTPEQAEQAVLSELARNKALTVEAAVAQVARRDLDLAARQAKAAPGETPAGGADPTPTPDRRRRRDRPTPTPSPGPAADASSAAHDGGAA